MGDPEGFYRADPDRQLDLLAYWSLCHASGSTAAAGGDYEPSPEDLRLMLARATTPGDLAWLWGKIQPQDPKKALAGIYIEPDAREDDLRDQIADLFIHYPEGEA